MPEEFKKTVPESAATEAVPNDSSSRTAVQADTISTEKADLRSTAETNGERESESAPDEANATDQIDDKVPSTLEGRLEKLEARLTNTPRRGWMESRFEDLEDRMRSLERYGPRSRSSSRNSKKDDKKTRLKSIPQAYFLTVDEYEKRGKFAIDKEHYAIDVVLAPSWRRKANAAKALVEERASADTPSIKGPTTTAARNDFGLLRFIQFNSRALINVFRQVTSDTPASLPDSPYVVLAPFKSLCYNEDALKAELAKLRLTYAEQKDGIVRVNSVLPPVLDVPQPQIPETTTDRPELDANGEAPMNSTDENLKAKSANAEENMKQQGMETAKSQASEGGQTKSETAKPWKQTDAFGGEESATANADGEVQTGTEKPQQPMLQEEDTKPDSLKAYEDLKCLLNFYDNYVKPWWDSMRGSEVKTVQYGDLCGLYQPGDLVVMPEASQRVCRVLKITGGRPYLNHLYSGKYEQSQEYLEDGGDVRTSKSAKGLKRRGGSDDSKNWSIFYLDCYYIDYDGKTFGAVHEDFKIKFFSGNRDVKLLRPYPLRFATAKTRQEFLADGKKFFELSRGGLHYYEGRTVTEKPNSTALKVRDPSIDDEDGGTKNTRQIRSEDVESQVVIDFDGTFQYNPQWAPYLDISSLEDADTSEDRLRELDDDAVLQDTELEFLDWFDEKRTERYRDDEDPWVSISDESPDGQKDNRNRFRDTSNDENDFLTLPNRVFGYVLRSRSWACFDLTAKANWQAIQEDSRGWNDLQLPKRHKETLESLVERHFLSREAARGEGRRSHNFDFIEGKGKGLIVLLHGAPGVGKTSTAESIATKYKKPLLPITCGNLGMEARIVEQGLLDNFQLAESWDCIVLLDEADVFLARREKKDLQRNGLVSVFLRTLEYYTGILFLTTNRTGDFDEAFRSRIHVALFYPDLTYQRTEVIWGIYLKRLLEQKEHDSQKLNLEDGGRAIIEFGKRHWEAYQMMGRNPWNGRQIRNAFQTAVALSEYEAQGELIKAKADGKTDSELAEMVPTLKWEKFREVAVASNQFEVYLIETRGFSDDEIAADNALRASGTIHPGMLGVHSQEHGQKLRTQRITATRAGDIIEKLHPYQPVWLPPDLYATAHGDQHNYNDPFMPQRKPTMNARIMNNSMSSAGAPMSGQQYNNQPQQAHGGQNMGAYSQQGMTFAQGTTTPQPPWYGGDGGFMNTQNSGQGQNWNQGYGNQGLPMMQQGLFRQQGEGTLTNQQQDGTQQGSTPNRRQPYSLQQSPSPSPFQAPNTQDQQHNYGQDLGDKHGQAATSTPSSGPRVQFQQ